MRNIRKLTKYIGYIKFEDHEEDILKMKPIENVTNVWQVITDDGFYVYDCTKLENGLGSLYKQVVSESTFPQTIKSQLHVCEFECFVIYNLVV